MYRSDEKKAEQMYTEALTLNKAIGRREGIASAYVGLGGVYMKLGDEANAKLMYEQALEIYSALSRKRELAPVYSNLGIISYTQGRKDEAESLWRRASTIYEELGNIDKAKEIQSWIRKSDSIIIEHTAVEDESTTDGIQ